MSGKSITPGLKGSCILSKSIFTIVLTLILISLLSGCGAPVATNQTSAGSPTTTANQVVKSSEPAIATPTPMKTSVAAPSPQGELIAALQGFGNENWLPWLDPFLASLHDIVYDLLIYWDHPNRKFIPGLAESWEVSPDGLTLTYHLRKGVQFSDGWGELTSEDVKFNFEMQASKTSVGKTSQTRRITSMDTPDPYTLVVHFKDPYPNFYVDLSMANSGVCQGIACKKYIEAVGVDAASQKPVGTGPYRLLESKSGDYFKFEAVENHWRVVPEFKNLTVRLIVETSTLVAALKTKEIDLSMIPLEQLLTMKDTGVAVEASPLGGTLLAISFGGLIIPADKRYDATYYNKDPWVDPRVRKAMAIAIDREALSKAMYAGFAKPAAVPLFSLNMDNYKYAYDPAAAKQLLKDAGYPDGFTFKVISYADPGAPESPRIMEALASFWQQIGLDPKINMIDYASYNSKNTNKAKTAGDVFFAPIGQIADMLSRAEMFLMPNVASPYFQDEGSYAIYQNNPKATFEERSAMVDKLNQYYFENLGPLPLVRIGYSFAWNPDKVSPWPHPDSSKPLYLDYVRHAQPLNTFRLFTPWPGR